MIIRNNKEQYVYLVLVTGQEIYSQTDKTA